MRFHRKWLLLGSVLATLLSGAAHGANYIMQFRAEGIRALPSSPVQGGEVPGELVEFRDGASPVPDYSFPATSVGGTAYKTLSVFNRNAQGITFAPTPLETLAPFSVVSTTCNGSLSSGQACSVTVMFAPQTPGYFTPDLTAWGQGGSGLTLLRAIVLYGTAN